MRPFSVLNPCLCLQRCCHFPPPAIKPSFVFKGIAIYSVLWSTVSSQQFKRNILDDFVLAFHAAIMCGVIKLEQEYKSFLDVTLKWFPIATNKKYILFNTVWTEVLQFKRQHWHFQNFSVWECINFQLFKCRSGVLAPLLTLSYRAITSNVFGLYAGFRRDESAHSTADQVPLEFWDCSQIGRLFTSIFWLHLRLFASR